MAQQRIFQLYIHRPDQNAIPNITTDGAALALSWTTVCVVKASLNRPKEYEDVTDSCSGGVKEMRPTYTDVTVEAEGIHKRDASDNVPAWFATLDTALTESESICVLLLDGPRTVPKSRGYYLLAQVVDLTDDFDATKSPRFKLKFVLDGVVTGVNKYRRVQVPTP